MRVEVAVRGEGGGGESEGDQRRPHPCSDPHTSVPQGVLAPLEWCARERVCVREKGRVAVREREGES